MNHFKKKYLKIFCNVLFAVSEKDATALFHIVRWKVNSVADRNVSQHFHIEMETLGRVFDYIWSCHANVILWCTYTNQRIYVLLSLEWKGKQKVFTFKQGQFLVELYLDCTCRKNLRTQKLPSIR